jgi:hypothetical protein
MRELRLVPANSISVTAPLLAGMQHLTVLQLATTNYSVGRFEPAALAGKTQLRHLDLEHCELHGAAPGEAAGEQALLSQLQQLTQLTYLHLNDVLHCMEVPAADFSALTASSQLEHLDVSADCEDGVWQYVLPTGRELPHLKHLCGDFADAEANPHPEDIARVAVCAPAVQELYTHWPLTAELLSPLTGLRELSTLMVELSDDQGVQVLAQLTRLRVLILGTFTHFVQHLDLSPLTQLQRLTNLNLAPTLNPHGRFENSYEHVVSDMTL